MTTEGHEAKPAGNVKTTPQATRHHDASHKGNPTTAGRKPLHPLCGPAHRDIAGHPTEHKASLTSLIDMFATLVDTDMTIVRSVLNNLSLLLCSYHKQRSLKILSAS